MSDTLSRFDRTMARVQWATAETAPSALVAAATIIEQARAEVDAASKAKREKWQTLAFDYRDQIPAIGFATSAVSNLVGRVRIFPAQVQTGDMPPVPLDETDPRYADAVAVLDLLRGDNGTHSEVLTATALQLSLPGECWLVGVAEGTADEPTTWGIYSIEEVRQTAEGSFVDWPGYGEQGRKLDVGNGPEHRDFLARIHRPHPKRRRFADSPMRQIVDDCDELILWERHFQATAKSRLPAGLLLYPSEVTFPPKPQVPGVPRYADDPFLNDLLTALVTPIQDPGSATAVAPTPIQMKGDAIDKVRLLTFAREVDPIAAARMEVLLRNIVQGLPLPNELVTGMGDVNHWNAWEIGEDSFRSHLAPLVELIVGGFAGAMLRPLLRRASMADDQVNGLTVWYDPSPLFTHPNRDKNALSALRLGVIGFPAARRHLGYTEDDAPTEDDLALLERIQPPRQPDRTGDIGLPATEGEARSIVAAATPTQRRDLSRRLARIDRALLDRTLDAVNVAADIAIDRAEGLTADAVDDLIAEVVAPVARRFDAWTAEAQAQVRAILAALSDDFDEAAAAGEQDEDRSAAVALLASAAVAAIASAIYGEAVAVAGEAGAGTVVQAGVVREALVRAGGGTSAINPATGDPVGGVATGPTALDLFASIGLTPDAWVWVYGDEERSPFLGHLDLDGREFLDWSDEALRVRDEDSWIGREFYRPGDHRGCRCTFEPVMGPSPTDEGGEAEAD